MVTFMCLSSGSKMSHSLGKFLFLEHRTKQEQTGKIGRGDSSELKKYGFQLCLFTMRESLRRKPNASAILDVNHIDSIFILQAT